jgi:hypothetical protein
MEFQLLSMKNIINICKISLILLLFAACTDVVELDVPAAEPEIVVDGELTNDRDVFVKLSQTAGFFDNADFLNISGAQVSIFEDGQEVSTLAESSTTAGLYESNFRGSINKTYRIRIEIGGNVPDKIAGIWWSDLDTMRAVPPLDSLKQASLDRNTTPQAFFPGEYALLYFGDLPGEGDFYRIVRNLNDSVFAQESIIFSDEGVDGAYFGGGIFPAVAIYGPFNEPEVGELPDSLGVTMQSVSPDFNNFMTVLNSQVNTGSPFDAPPALVLGNIRKEGEAGTFGFGYFRVVGSSRIGLVYQP